MANTLNPIDVYALINTAIDQATNMSGMANVNATNFASTWETMQRVGTEKVLNQISTVLSSTIFSSRVYNGNLYSLRSSDRRWGAQLRKITYLYDGYEQSEDNNTDLLPNQFDDGNSIDHYKIRKPKVLQTNLYGTKVLQKHITRFRDQLSVAFTSESEFLRFINGVMVEYGNQITLANEAETRLTLLNYMGGLNQLGRAIDLVAAYNTENSTTLTREQLLQEPNLESFMKFVASTIKIYSSYLTDYTNQYHTNIANYQDILRFTPKTRQRMIMYNPIFIRTQSTVYPTLFNPQYLDIGSFEGVNYWQNPVGGPAINVTPTIIDTTTGNSTDGTAQNVEFVLGLLFDEEALGINAQFNYASTTPFNSAGGYYNMYNHWRFNSFCDYTENAILFTLGAGGAP